MESSDRPKQWIRISSRGTTDPPDHHSPALSKAEGFFIEADAGETIADVSAVTRIPRQGFSAGYSLFRGRRL